MEHPMYECKNCNKIFECRDRHRKAKFCSHSCYAESLRKNGIVWFVDYTFTGTRNIFVRGIARVFSNKEKD